MKKVLRKIFAAFTVFAVFTLSAFAEPAVSVQLDRTEIYRGETFVYQLILSDTAPISVSREPDIAAWSDFNVQTLPVQSGQTGGMKSTIIINGKVIKDEQSESKYSTKYTYVLEPKRAGTLTIPPPVIDGGRISAAALKETTVRVVEPEKQDTVMLTIQTDRTRLYPWQPLDVTLTIHIKALTGQHANTDPLSLLRQPPQLQIPWAKENFAKGMVGEEPLETWLNKLVLRPPQRGFAVNDYGGTRMGFGGGFGGGFFDDMFQREAYQFSGKPKLVSGATNSTTSGLPLQAPPVNYWEYRFVRRFLPQEFGNYAFGPVTLKGMLPVADAAGNVTAKQFYAAASTVNVTVADVPQGNRPADYIGAFGTFRLETQLEPKKARVGDPITLTLRLTGQGSTAGVRPPDLNSAAAGAVAENFRIHAPTEDVNDKSCTFTYTIRPKKPGSVVFPPLSVSVFDVQTEKFQTLQSVPIPLEIEEAKNVSAAANFGTVNTEDNLQVSEKGLFANKTSPNDFLPVLTTGLDYRQWGIALAAFAAAYGLLAVGLLLLQNRRTDTAGQRRRGAMNRAKKQLLSVRTTEDLQNAVFGFAADVADADENGMTTADACRLLRERNAPETAVLELQGVLESLDAAVYGGLALQPLDALTKIAEAALRKMNGKVNE